MPSRRCDDFYVPAGEGCFAHRRDPLLPSAAKVGKNAVQTCGLKIRPRSMRCAVRGACARMGECGNRPKCGSEVRRSPLLLAAQNIEVRTGAFQSKSGSAQRSKSIQHFGRFSTHWKRRKEIQKPWVFGGVLFPISSAVGRNGAAGGIKSDPRRGAEYPGDKSSGGAHSSGPSGTPAPTGCSGDRRCKIGRRWAQKKRDAGASLFSTLQRLWLCKKLTSARPCRRPPRPASS